jgi:hypothetical protein
VDFVVDIHGKIWSTATSGSLGQKARFVAKNTQGVLASGIGSSGWIQTDYYPYWYGDWENPYYLQIVKTPPEEIGYSGKIFKYSASGWVMNDDQLEPPDICESFGLARPGDYLGPWFLNDLRDAINQLTWTVQARMRNSWLSSNGLIRTYYPDVYTEAFIGGGPLNVGSTRVTSVNLSGAWEKTGYHLNVSNTPIPGPTTDPLRPGYPTSSYLLSDTEMYTYFSNYYNEPYEPAYNSGTNPNGISPQFEFWPGRYTRASRDYPFGSGASWLDDLEQYHAYAYVKPSGSDLADGINRKYYFYSTTQPMGGYVDGGIYDSQYNYTHTLYTTRGDIGNYSPTYNTDVPGIVSYFDPDTGTTVVDAAYTTVMKYLGFYEADHYGEDVGIRVGPSFGVLPEGDFADGSAGGYITNGFYVITDWAVPSGFKYTKDTPIIIIYMYTLLDLLLIISRR